MDEALIMEVWDTFKEYIPEKNKDMAATQYVSFLLGKDVDMADIEGMLGYDSHLDDAIKTVIDEEGYHDEAEEDEDNYGYEDEDY